MPSQRSRAAFEPIAPDVDIPALVESTPNFEYADRITCDAIDDFGLEKFEKIVLGHVILGGKPLVIGGFNERLDSSVFSERWLRARHSKTPEIARELAAKKDIPLTIGHYLNHLPRLTKKLDAYNYRSPEKQRLYLKDIDCPQEWHTKLKELIPPTLFYLNKSPQRFQGPGSNTVPLFEKPEPKTATGISIAPAGDLMSCLPDAMRAQNLMCYIGHEGTYTPAHQEMCASLGQNIMVEASDGSVEHGEPTKPGSSIWFMTESKDRGVVSEYWMSVLGHDIDIEDHFAQINAWKSAPFKTYIVEQRVGDFILVPPLAAHQVWNRGTRTMKVAWNRTTVQTLKLALNEALPHARMVCRDEQYKNKAIVFYSLEHYSALLSQVNETQKAHPKVQQLRKDFEQLFNLYTSILLSEHFVLGSPKEKDMEYIKFDSNITCSYCRANIFNRFLTCPWCASDEDNAYDICMECYVMGRSCACISNLKWAEQFRWKDLTKKYESWRRLLMKLTGASEEKYPCLAAKRSQLGKKTLAEICQEQLKRRPWVDITKPAVQPVEEGLSDPDKPARKRRKTRPSDKNNKVGRCHICKYLDPSWKLASCSNCHLSYCYGSLFRAFNIKPQDVLELYHWICPKCQKFCSCYQCRRDPTMTPYEPENTHLGHDTRKIADPRSVESLVDQRHSNARWLKKAGDDEINRLMKHQREADERRNQALVEHDIQLEELTQIPPTPENNYFPQVLPQYDYSEDVSTIPVDPALQSLDESFLTPQLSLNQPE
ncbi:JmjC domain protein [Aspergillus ambiguus]|uniref:putative JmjC domain protein n=1 Tax=Aspergillus ambiguus TaxID=176160 RepID=UPI003CCD5056